MKVLVVEDDLALREALEDYLPEHGITPLLAQNGDEGFEIARRDRPVAIVMDVGLPGTDGFAECRRLTEAGLTEDVPVVFLTARADPADKLEGFASGGVDYLTKPFQLEELVMRLRYHVDRARIERELRETNLRLRQEGERLDKLLSIVAHDVVGPLEGLSLVLDNMTKDPSLRTDDAIETLGSTVGSVRKLVDELLVWVRTGVVGTSPVKHPVQVAAVAKRNLQMLKSLAEAKRLALEARVGAHVWVHTDRNMLDTVVRNLLINAVKFTEEEGRVCLRASRAGGEVCIEVIDEGVGIPEDHLPHLFEPRPQRYSTQGTRGERGSGLGLALAARMVEALGGRIEVSSTVGRGSTFTVRLPDPSTEKESGSRELASGGA